MIRLHLQLRRDFARLRFQLRRGLARTCRGFTLLETVLFFGILSIMSGTLVAVYIATQEARVRQHAIAELEQGGTQLLETFNRHIRRAEKVLVPIANTTGSILTLQMALNGEFPTILAPGASGTLVLAQKTLTSALLTQRVRISNLTFRNVGDANVMYSFDLVITLPTIPPKPYSRHYSATATLFPDDQSEAGGCGSCSVPACTGGVYQWRYCASGVCTLSDTVLSC